MKIGLFSPSYSSEDSSTPSLFVDGLRHGLNHFGIEVRVFTGDGPSAGHWYDLPAEYNELDALILPLDNDKQLALCRHVARLFPCLPVLLTGNFFSGTYDELRELSTAKILRRRFLRENAGRESLVNSLADVFERSWNADIYERVLTIREDVTGENCGLRFTPVNIGENAADAVELEFPLVIQSVPRAANSGRPLVIVDSPPQHSHYLATLAESASSRGIKLVIDDRARRPVKELLRMCAAADLVISVSPLPGYSAVTIGALSVGTPVAAPFSSSYRDIVAGAFSLSPGFTFSRSINELFDQLVSGGEVWNEGRNRQRELVAQYFDSTVVAKKLIDSVKDHGFFLRGAAKKFESDIEAAKLAMLGEALE